MPATTAKLPTAAERAALKLASLRASTTSPRAADWRRGDLRWKLENDRNQLGLYDWLKGLTGKQGVVEGARKLGKSFMFGCIALETAIRNPGRQINWTAGTAKQCIGILKPILEELSADAPADCRGHYNHQTGEWVMPNRAVIRIVSCETKKLCERGRGPSTILNIVDEGGFIDLLDYLLDSIFSPQLRRVKRAIGTFVGLTLICSTTPYVPTHTFCTVADAAAATGAYQRRTIYDSGFETPEEIAAYIAGEAAKKNLSVEAFKKTSTFRREFMSERVVDTERVVFPEFGEALVAAQAAASEAGLNPLHALPSMVREWERPIGFDQYIHKRTAVDPGGTRDPTGILSGYVDFTNAKAVVEGERLMMRPNTAQIAEAVVELETELWGEPPPPEQGSRFGDRHRISRPIDDPTGRISLDLWELNGLHCEQAVKNDRNASIGLIRTWLVDGTLVIHPRCVVLRRQLLTALNNKTRTDFERNSEGHCDVAAALMYWCRGLSLVTNPYPPDFDKLTGRAMPDQHPVAARREQMGEGRHVNTLAGQILSGNRFVQGQLRRRR